MMNDKCVEKRILQKKLLKIMAAVHHTMLQPCLDFWREFGPPVVPGGHMDPKWPEFEIGMVLDPDPPEILPPGTPGVSHGTKKNRQNFSHIIKIRCYFMHFGDLLQKQESNLLLTGCWKPVKIRNIGKTSHFFTPLCTYWDLLGS